VKFGVVVFPGSNCEVDAHEALRYLEYPVRYLWHAERDLGGVDVVVLPGGFSYGDYLRAGAIAAWSPILSEIREFAERGGLVLGICNGFQILTEAGLLPGALGRNEDLVFHCETVHLRVENANTPFTRELRVGEVLRMPIAHGEGRYWAPPEELDRLARTGGVVLRYCGPRGEPTADANPNGSLEDIAAVCNPEGNVVGMMPHPERAAEAVLGGEDGRFILRSALLWAAYRAHGAKGVGARVGG